MLGLLTVQTRAEELGTLEKSVTRGIIVGKGYKGAEITASDKTPYTVDGRPGWMVVVQFTDSTNKTYIARIWMNKVWTTNSVISITQV